MSALFSYNFYFFSIESLLKQKRKFKHKICYREKLVFLKNKQTPVNSLATRLMKRGCYLRILRTLMRFFITHFIPFIKKLPSNNHFKVIYSMNYTLRDFNRILFWRIGLINSLFNFKKIKKRQFVYYLQKTRRVNTVFLWLKSIIRMKQQANNNNSPRLFNPLLVLLTDNQKSNQLHKIKLKIYKARLLKGF